MSYFPRQKWSRPLMITGGLEDQKILLVIWNPRWGFASPFPYINTSNLLDDFPYSKIFLLTSITLSQKVASGGQ